MTNQQGAPEAPSYEHQRAIMEGERNASLDAYSRVVYLTQTESRIYEAGFTNGWNRLAALVEAEQPAPSAAGVGNSGFDYKTAADFLNGKTVSDEAMRKFVAASRWAHDDRVGLRATLLSVRGELASREAEIALLKKALMDAEAPQPSPTPQADSAPSAASKAVLAAIRAANMQLVRTGDDSFMLVTYKQATPQADSQPAPVLDGTPPPCDQELFDQGVSVGLFDLPKWTVEEICRGIAAATGARVDWHYIGGRVHIKALPAARAPADSVTAQSSGLVVGYRVSDPHEPDLGHWLSEEPGAAWCVSEPLALATPPTQAADSVLEDAARLERERICAEIKAEDDYCVDQGDYMLDSDDCIKIVRGEWVRPDFAIDAARKQGANHDNA